VAIQVRAAASLFSIELVESVKPRALLTEAHFAPIALHNCRSLVNLAQFHAMAIANRRRAH
jgi:hypothetical protein